MKTKIICKSFLAIVTLAISVTGLFAQNFKCGTTQAQNELYKTNPELEQFQEGFDKYCDGYSATHYGVKSSAIMTIPVVFHVIHNYGSENISDAQIFDAINQLNIDYNKLNADTASVAPEFQNLIADVKVEFKLAQYDPDGNCTNGIDRIVSSETYIGNDHSKLNPWPDSSYLNFWVVNSLENSSAAITMTLPNNPSGKNVWNG